MSREHLVALVDAFLAQEGEVPSESAALQRSFAMWLHRQSRTADAVSAEPRVHRARSRRAPSQPPEAPPIDPPFASARPEVLRVLDLYFKRALGPVIALPPVDAMEAARAAFLDRFGPRALRSLGDHDALEVLALTPNAAVGMDHWLEQRRDDVFDGRLFGATRGGTALKFAVFQGPDGVWKRKARGVGSAPCTEAEAAEIVGRRRDALVGAAEVVLQWQSQPIADRDPWVLARSVAHAAQPWSDSPWMRQYLHLVAPDVIGNVRPETIFRFGVGLPEAGVLSKKPIRLAADAHLSTILLQIPSLARLPPLQRWAAVRAGYWRTAHILGDVGAVRGDGVEIQDPEVPDLRTVRRLPRSRTNRARNMLLRTLNLAKPGDLIVSADGGVWSLQPGVDGGSVRYDHDPASDTHRWTVDYCAGLDAIPGVSGARTPRLQMGLLESVLLHEGCGSWPKMLQVVGPPSSRRPLVPRVRRRTLSSLHSSLGISARVHGTRALDVYTVRHGLRHLLSIPDQVAAHSVLLDPIVHRVAETDSGLQQVRGAWAALQVQGPEGQWREAIAAQLPDTGRERVVFLREAAGFALGLEWADAALWATRLLVAPDMSDADRLLRIRALTASADASAALVLLNGLAPPVGLSAQHKRWDLMADLLIRLKDFEAAESVLDRHDRVSPAVAVAEDFLRDVARGQCALGLGKIADAEELAGRALSGLSALLGDQNPVLLRVMELRVQVFQAQQNAEASVQGLTEMLALAHAVYGSGHAVPLRIQQRLSVLEADETGIARLRDALVAGVRRLGVADSHLHSLRLALADRLWGTGQHRNSLAILQRALRWVGDGSAVHEDLLLRLATRFVDIDPAMAGVWGWHLLTLRPEPTALARTLCLRALASAGRTGWQDRIRMKGGEVGIEPRSVVRLVVPDGPLRAAINRMQKTQGRRHPHTIGLRLLEWRANREGGLRVELWEDGCATFGAQHPATLQLARELGFPAPQPVHPWLQDSLPWY